MMKNIYKTIIGFTFFSFSLITESIAQSTTIVPPPEAATGTFQCTRGSQRLQGTQYMKGNFSGQPVVKWLGQLTTTNGGCEGEPVIGDVDGNGTNEVLEPAGNGNLFCFNGSTGANMWTKAGVGAEMSALIGDANTDGFIDIISVWDHVYCLDGATGNIIWTFSPIVLAGTNIETCPNMADLDNDGMNDVVIIVNNTCYAVNGLNGTIKWQYTTGAPGVSFNGSTPAIGDLNGDGILDVVASLQNGSNAQRLVALNGNNGSVIWNIAASSSFTGLAACVPAIGDIDGDCDLDVVYNKAGIRGTDGTVLFGNPSASFGATFCILADLDDNCTVEFVTGCGVYNAMTGATIWQLGSCSLNGWFAPAPRVGDFSPASPGKEIVLAGAYNINNPINMFAGITGTPLWSFSMAGLNHTAEGVSVGDIDNDGCVEIVVAPDCCNGDNTVLALDDNSNATSCGILASIGQVDFFPHDTTACNCVDYYDFSSLCANNWSWSFPGGTPATSTSQNPGTVCYATPGTYAATMIAHLNACASADTITHTINIISCGVAPVVLFQSSDTAICANECINFTDMTTNSPTNWSWSFPGGTPTSSTAQNPTGICYLNGGTFDVTLVAGNAGGTDSVTLTNYILVYPAPPAPTITQVGDTLFVPAVYTSYQWYFGSDTIIGANNFFYVATQSGNYNIAVTDEHGCVVGTGILNVIASVNQWTMDNGQFTIVPNPARDEFTIYGLPFTVCEINIYNSLGEKVYSTTTVNRKQETINCKRFAEGIYIVQIKSSSGIVNKKFIISR